jgi:ketosteroid isomerase-like protein
MGNVATVQGIYEAFGTGDVATIVDCMADDVVWEHWEDNRAQAAGVPSLQARDGKAGVSEFFAVAATMGITDFQVLNLLEGNNQIAATVVIESDVPGGGHYRDEEIHLWSFDANGKVKALRHYVDTAKHIAAWGL